MKTAIICDWLVTFAGGERFLGELIKCFPDADLFAVIDFMPEHQREFLQGKPVKTTYIQRFPWAKKLYRHYLPWMPLAIEQLDLSAYQLIISSSHAVAKGILAGPDQIHVSYVHSPMRYVWDLQHQYLKETGLGSGIKGFFIKRMLHSLRLWDQRTANGVDYFITNSQYIARRIWKTYRRKATIIHPPVDTSAFKAYPMKENFYVTASRMVPYKKIDLIVESFSAMPDKKLIVIGDGPDFEKIKMKAKTNIELLGYQPTEKLIHYMQRAKAFVFAAEEDFGLVPVEAQACGTPVIAFGKGGALETVKDLSQSQPTGIFFPEQTIASLCEAVQTFEQNREKLTLENCVNQAARFSAERFRKEFMEFVEKIQDPALHNFSVED